jgi:hypothetical protein
MSLYHDLVAGDGVPGFRDGEFHRARFKDPAGIAVLAGGTIVVVADQSNNRIRAIHLDQGNRVETLAGSTAGAKDGSFQEATFSLPGAMVAISDHAVLVNDEGNALFRVLDLQTRRVETIAGSGARGAGGVPARSAELGGVTSLAYSPAEDAVFFAQPDFGALRRLDLKARTIRPILLNDPRLTRPTILAFLEGQLCIADGDGRVIRVEQTSPDHAGQRTLRDAGRGKNIRAMVESEGRLYAIQGDTDAPWIILDTGHSWAPPSVLHESTSIPYLRFGDTEPVGLVADPRSARSFLLTAPAHQRILCVKDYRFAELSDKAAESSGGLIDFEYPPQKPPRTFRILMIGDSHINFFFEPGYRKERFTPQKIEGMPKRLELMLNTLGAMENSRTRYEVLTLMRVSWNPLLVWSANQAPAIAKKFDADLVLLMEPPGGAGTIQAYLERPITERGIPANEPDMEYLLKPVKERLRNNPAAALVARARARGWVYPLPNSENFAIENIAVLSTDPAARKEILNLHARPITELRKGLEASFAGGRRPPLVLCYYLLGSRIPGSPGVQESPFWKDVASASGAEYLDLTDLFVALSESWAPLSEGSGNDHFTPGGHSFFAFLLAHELLRNGWVPMAGAAGSSPRGGLATTPARPPEPRRLGTPPRGPTPPPGG